MGQFFLLADGAGSMRVGALWPIAVPAALGLVAVYLLLPRPRSLPVLWGSLFAAAALITGGWFLIWSKTAHPETILFFAFSAVAIVFGGLLITQRNPVHAALAFALVVLSTCGLFLLQAAPFLMAATAIVYAGAIVVTFLFVIMLAQQAGLSDADHRSREPELSCVAGFVLLAALLYLLQLSYDVEPVQTLVSDATQAHHAVHELLQRGSHQELTPPEVRETLEQANWEGFLKELQQQAAKPDNGHIESLSISVRSSWSGLQGELERKQRADTPESRVLSKDGMDRLKELQSSLHEFVWDPLGHTPRPDAVRPLSAFSGPPATALPAPLPHENVAALGRSLFTDYLIPVELAGTLLLVATIGAIAISGRRREGLR